MSRTYVLSTRTVCVCHAEVASDVVWPFADLFSRYARWLFSAVPAARFTWIKAVICGCASTELQRPPCPSGLMCVSYPSFPIRFLLVLLQLSVLKLDCTLCSAHTRITPHSPVTRNAEDLLSSPIWFTGAPKDLAHTTAGYLSYAYVTASPSSSFSVQFN